MRDRAPRMPCAGWYGRGRGGAPLRHIVDRQPGPVPGGAGGFAPRAQSGGCPRGRGLRRRRRRGGQTPPARDHGPARAPVGPAPDRPAGHRPVHRPLGRRRLGPRLRAGGHAAAPVTARRAAPGSDFRGRRPPPVRRSPPPRSVRSPPRPDGFSSAPPMRTGSRDPPSRRVGRCQGNRHPGKRGRSHGEARLRSPTGATGRPPTERTSKPLDNARGSGQQAAWLSSPAPCSSSAV